MDKITTKRGDEFKRILIREYQDRLLQAVRLLAGYRRELALYEYTPVQVARMEEAIRLTELDIVIYSRALGITKGPIDEKLYCVIGM